MSDTEKLILQNQSLIMFALSRLLMAANKNETASKLIKQVEIIHGVVTIS